MRNLSEPKRDFCGYFGSSGLRWLKEVSFRGEICEESLDALSTQLLRGSCLVLSKDINMLRVVRTDIS